MAANSAREEILARIRTAIIAGNPPATAPAGTIEEEWSAIQRNYRRTGTRDAEALMHQLEDRLRDYDAGVYRCTSADLRGTIASVLRERGMLVMAHPAGLPQAWLPDGIIFVEDARAEVAQVDACQGVLTSATLAIAETGTIVLQDVAGQGRRAASLLPDYHLCVVDAASIVQSVPEAMAKLAATAHLATTFFSGPSATADIEMTRIKGVHGPRFVDVIFCAPFITVVS